jgi:hypothetical protein
MIEHIVVPHRKLFFMESELTNIQKKESDKKIIRVPLCVNRNHKI